MYSVFMYGNKLRYNKLIKIKNLGVETMHSSLHLEVSKGNVRGFKNTVLDESGLLE